MNPLDFMTHNRIGSPVSIGDLGNSCPHWYKYCRNNPSNTWTPGCFRYYHTCAMYNGIRDGQSPWEWKIAPPPDSDWWKNNTDEISLREVDKYQFAFDKK